MNDAELLEWVSEIIDKVRWENSQHLSPQEAAKIIIPIVSNHEAAKWQSWRTITEGMKECQTNKQ